MKRLLFCILAGLIMGGTAFAALTWEATQGETEADCNIVWTADDGATFVVSLRGAEISIPPCLEITNDTFESVTLAWDANTETCLRGYKIHFGAESRSYTHHYDVGNVTQYTVSGLSSNTLYYFAATAYSDDAESDYSNEVSWTTTPMTDIIIDNRDTDNVSSTQTWTVSGAQGYYGDDSVTNRTNGTFSFLAEDLRPGAYEVWLWSSPWHTRCNNSHVQIQHLDGITDMYINQQVGGEWVLLGEFRPADNRLTIIMRARTACSTGADAVKIVRVP